MPWATAPGCAPSSLVSTLQSNRLMMQLPAILSLTGTGLGAVMRFQDFTDLMGS